MDDKSAAPPPHRMQGILDSTVPDDALLTPGEVAVLFAVNAKTVTRWARVGRLEAVKTLGGHRRFRAAEIRRALASQAAG